MSSAECHLRLLDSIVHRPERLCEGELYCLGHRRKVSTLCLLYKIYYRGNYTMNEYLNHFHTARYIKISAALGELDLVKPRCSTDQFSWSFLSAAVRPWNLQQSSVFSGGTLNYFKRAINL